MRSTLVLAILVLLASFAAPAFAQGKSPGTHARAAANAHAAEVNDFQNLSATAREHGLANAEAHHAFARFAYANGAASGRYVSFHLNESTGALTSFGVNATNGTVPVFTSVAPDAFVGNGSAKVAGSVLHLDDTGASFSAHNNPTANFDYAAGDANLTITLTLAPNVSVVSWPQGYRLNLPGGLHAHVFATGNGTLSIDANNTTITASLPGNSSLFFLRHPGEGHMTSDVHDVLAGLATGRVGAVTSIVDADGAPLEDRTFAGVRTHARDASRGHANVTLSSDDATGKAVVLNLDRSVIAPENVSRVVVTLDGQPLARLAKATDALNATNASVWFNATADGVQVIVSVPHFSDHDLSIQTVDATTQPTPTASASATSSATATATTTPEASPTKAPGVELVGLVLVAGVAALLLQRRS